MTDEIQTHEDDGQDSASMSMAERVRLCMEKYPHYKWYVLKVTTGHEMKVHSVMQERMKLENVEASVGEVLIPTEEVVEKRGGKSRKVNKRFFPGYVLIYMDMTDIMWHFMRRLPGVQGFIGGSRNKPLPVSEAEVMKIIRKLEPSEAGVRTTHALFDPGESVKVIDGPFADFNGVIEEVNHEKGRLVVSVLIFGRSTPVELEFNQVEKV